MGHEELFSVWWKSLNRRASDIILQVITVTEAHLVSVNDYRNQNALLSPTSPPPTAQPTGHLLGGRDRNHHP
jgi:hypothetical protein